jgi:hypothetical protein
MTGYCLSFLLVAFLQASFVGEWRGDLKLPERNGVPGNVLPYQFVFKVDGEKLSGTIHWNNNTFEIGDGEISGNKVRFVQLQKNSNGGISRTFVYEGEISGDELLLTRSQLGGGPSTSPVTGAPRQPTPSIKFSAQRVSPVVQAK